MKYDYILFLSLFGITFFHIAKLFLWKVNSVVHTKLSVLFVDFQCKNDIPLHLDRDNSFLDE